MYIKCKQMSWEKELGSKLIEDLSISMVNKDGTIFIYKGKKEVFYETTNILKNDYIEYNIFSSKKLTIYTDDTYNEETAVEYIRIGNIDHNRFQSKVDNTIVVIEF